MIRTLAQAITLPGEKGPVPINYPSQWGDFAKTFDSIGSLVSRAVPFVFAFAGIGLLLMILGAGFGMLTSAGDPKKLEGAKGRLTNAVIGFLIIFVSYWLVQLAGIVFGIPEIGTIFK